MKMLAGYQMLTAGIVAGVVLLVAVLISSFSDKAKVHAKKKAAGS